MEKDRSDYKIHAKQVRPININALKELMDDDLLRRWKLVSRILDDPTWYTMSATSEHRGKAFASMRSNQFEEFRDAGYVRAMEKPPLGFVHMFLVPEDHKRRFRVIAHTLTINQSKDFESFSLPSVRDIKGATERAQYGAAFDMRAWFHQFELAEAVREFYGFKVNHKWWQLLRLPMGARPSCALAQAAILALTRRASQFAKVFCYIDNVLFLGDHSQVSKAIQCFLEDCGKVDAQINEGGDTEPKQNIEYCGLLLDLHKKTIDVTPKVIAKLQTMMGEGQQMSHRIFAGAMSTLMFIERVRGRSIAGRYELREKLHRIQQYIGTDYDKWDEQCDVDDVIWNKLCAWADEAITTKEQEMKYPVQPKTLLIVDACEKGWGAICFRNGGCKMAAGGASKKSWSASAVSEPWGWYEATKNLLRDGEAVLLMTDNEALAHCVNKGYAKSWHYNETIRRAQTNLPRTQWEAVHIPGSWNPADEISRGEALNPAKLTVLATVMRERFGCLTICETAVRWIGDLAGRSIPFRTGVTPLGGEI
jgi:hypothetical protein